MQHSGTVLHHSIPRQQTTPRAPHDSNRRSDHSTRAAHHSAARAQKTIGVPH